MGTKAANPWGLRDVHGNVWEWCWDWYQTAYPAGTATDDRGPGTGSNRVNRGGAWNRDAQDCRCAIRYNSFPGGRYSHVGFRLARVSAR